MKVVDVFIVDKESRQIPIYKDCVEYIKVEGMPTGIDFALSEPAEFRYKQERWPIKEIVNQRWLDDMRLEVVTDRQYVAVQPELMELISKLDAGERSHWESRVSSLREKLLHKEDKLLACQRELEIDKSRLEDWNSMFWLKRVALSLFGCKP